MAKYTLQKNPRRLALELRPQPEAWLWKKWVIEIRREFLNYEIEHGELPRKGSRIARVDWLRRMFDSHGSSLLEAIQADHDDDAYWTRLVNHPGGSQANYEPFESASAVLMALPYNRNTLEYRKNYAK